MDGIQGYMDSLTKILKVSGLLILKLGITYSKAIWSNQLDVLPHKTSKPDELWELMVRMRLPHVLLINMFQY
jgi:hypothetical protein